MALKTASSLLLLLLLVSIIQGLQDDLVFHYKTMEAVVGQNISLPCIVKEVGNSITVSSEWSKKDKKDTKPSKLALYAARYGEHLFSPNVTLKIINDTGKLVGTNLELYNINKWHAGTYICDHTSFPLGTLQSETILTIKDKIECDKKSTIEVNLGENVTIHCSKFTGVNYTWTTDKTVVSDSPSLELLYFSEAMAGLYTLTVNTGSKRLHVKFTITVQKQTTNLYTDVTTLAPHYSSSGVPEALVNSSVTEYEQTSITSIPTTYSQPNHTENTSTDPTYTTHTESFNASHLFNQTVSFNTNFNQSFTTSFNQSESTTLTHNQSETFTTSLTFNQTIETTTSFNKKYTTLVIETNSTLNNPLEDSLLKSFPTLAPATSLVTTTLVPDSTQTSRPGNTTDVTVEQDPGDLDGQSHVLMLTLVFVGGLLLVSIVAIVLYRRRLIKKRMDLPPPFKPPPPPVKYTAASSPPQHFPTDRCNSIPAVTVEIRHSFV